MNIKRFEKASFAVIGKKGSTSDGAGFIPRLWDDANSHFGEVQHLAKRDETGNLIGIWGAMSDFSGSGKTSAMGFILQELSVGMMPRPRKGGPSGLSLDMNISV